MTEQEARDELFKLHFEYMMHTPKEREKLYDEYIEKRRKIKEELSKLVLERKEKEAVMRKK